ncbi:MAG: CZB domain-containing protein [Sulfuritalea sp.]|nr:CZB domain-containing protein [Sulfuritalea sp.]
MQAFDFDEAITLHRSWKMKFHLALDRVQGQDFDSRPIGDAAHCSLGQWLAGNAEELERFASAGELLTVHEEFHRQAQSIADAIKTGKIVRLSDKFIIEFGILSGRIEALLLRLKAETGQAG